MLQTPPQRAAAICVLALALGALVVGFGAWDSPSTQSLEERLAGGTHGTDGDGGRTGGDASGADRAGGSDGGASADDGGVGRTVAQLVDRYGQGLYLYGVSLAAALWIAARLRSQWSFDREALALVPADEAFGLSDDATGATEGRDDA